MRRLLAVLFSLALTAPALSHEGGHHVKGTIKAITAHRIVVTEPSGKEVTFAVTQSTEFLRMGRPVRFADVRPGERVVVHGSPDGGSAAAVMLGPLPTGR